MDIDNINDVETLKIHLKKFMTKCKISFEKQGVRFNKDEYYFVDQNQDFVYIYDDNMTIVTLDYNEVGKYLY